MGATVYGVLKPLLFSLRPADAHGVAMAALAPLEFFTPLRAAFRVPFRVDARLGVQTMGLAFPNPIGIAGGLDKNADRARAFSALGFGHVELGTVTARPQRSNPPPNMFRLPADRALINRLGFPNEGAETVARRILARRKGIKIPLGVSIGKSRDVPFDRALDDYWTSFEAVRHVADFVVVNVSSPNTKDLRAMQQASIARPLFESLVAARGPSGPPLLVKIAPDLPDDAIDAVVSEAMAAGFAGIVATNSTVSRDHLATPRAVIDAIGPGGLSGKPLFARALTVVQRVRQRVGPHATVIGVGGVDSTESALAMLRVGADLVQIYTGLVYEGPLLAQTIAKGMLAQMEAAGVTSIHALRTS